jgi:predicted HTH transcriptional regulator
MTRADRIRACYLHACLCYVMRQPMTNASLRQRLGIDHKNIATASRLLGEAVESGLIVVADPEVGTRIRSYLPFWAAARPNRGEVV